ncbi:PREDICTED: antigen KI-67 [Chrysochloris asiatica]|uniref:Antigen KI-67 n=1 Tax=Chrysochloris asiatica TaxID=185453 RepID=A0A9B0TRV5_CHRAS|nr:PREDICTED: antigen KI-67 [Chrysochloris asiatica]
MGPLGRLVVIKRTGNDGTHFPLCRDTCSFGRGIDCDIRIQLPVVSQQHCRIDIQQQEALLINFSTSNPTQLNGAPINEPVKLKHGDIITIIDRSFSFPAPGAAPAVTTYDSPAYIRENKNEEMSFKRRRVSFGGRLRPELFDENLPPNTPLKRGEAPGKRKSLGTPAPTVLKKIMKVRQEQSPAPGKGTASAEIRGKSWADVVKLGTKKQEVKSVQQGPHKPKSKKRKRNRTPQKPLEHVENPFSTGHATSPCTIIIGRAHVDKVSLPAPRYRILNNFISYRKQMYTEDFSGLTEMFQTPGKEKAKRTSMSPGTVHPDLQAVNSKLSTDAKERPEPRVGVNKHLRNSTKKTAQVEEPTGFKTRGRTRKHPYERAGDRKLQKTPHVYPEEDGTQVAMFPTVNDSETVHISRGGKKTLRNSQKSPSADEALKEQTVASRSRGRSRRDVRLPAGFSEGMPTEEHEQPVKSLQEKSKPTGEAKKVLRSRRKLNTHSDLVTPSAETSPKETESRVTRSAEAFPTETESQVTRSAEAFPTKTEPRVTRSAKAFPTETKPHVTRSAVTTPMETESCVTCSAEAFPTETKSRVTRSAKAFPTESKPRVTRSAATTPMETESCVTRSAEAFPTETKPRVTRSREAFPAKTEPRVRRSAKAFPAKTEPRVTRSSEVVPVDPEESRVTRSAEAFPVETGESHDPSSTAARVAVKRDEEEAEAVTHPVDKASKKRVATRGLRSRRGPSALDIPSPPDTCKTTESGEARRTRGVRHPEPAKQVAQEQESSVEVKTRQRGKRLGKEAQPAPSLPTIQEETGYTDKDDDADGSIPTQDGQGLRSRRRKKVSTEPEGHMSVTSPTETKPPEKPAAKSRPQKEAVTSAALPCVRSGRRNKAPVSTASTQESDPEPSAERAPSGKRAVDPAPEKVTDDKVTGLRTRSSKLRSRNQTKPEPTKKTSCNQSDIKSLPRVTRGSKRAISEETATQDPKQDSAREHGAARWKAA